jgi:hypothetical protein
MKTLKSIFNEMNAADKMAVKLLSCVIVMASVCLLLCSCEKVPIDGASDGGGAELGSADEPAVVGKNEKNFTFTVKGDWQNATFTRANGYLSADGKDMTDLWVFDYMGDVLMQTIHQTPESAGDAWGKPQMALKYGDHHVYFVASRGTTPTVDGNVITWVKASDTFWKDYAVTVGSTTNGNRAVACDRVATKLKLSPTDEVPATCAVLKITPAVWYNGLNYRTGAAVGAVENSTTTIEVPAAYQGTTGQMSVSIFGISGTSEWNASVTLSAEDADGNSLGSVVMTTPMLRNRSTEMSGGLFAVSGVTDVSLNATWVTAHTGTW